MREILFRGKRIDTGEWVEGSYVLARDIVSEKIGHLIVKIGTDMVRGELFDFEIVDPSTVGQYTGLTANGKKIFEGDIVSGFFNHEKIVGYILYGSDASFFIQRDGLLGIGLNNASDWLEVIGNIHDNPELLEGA